MIFLKVSLPENCHVLLLEDSEMRISWFEKRLPILKICRSVQEFKEYFDTKPTVDFIFWDHDLGDGGSGYDAAQFITDRFGSGGRWGLIHSWNSTGAKKMQTLLIGALHVPFGEFEVEIDK
jgi:hypothetical protein